MTLPFFPLPETVVFPGMSIPLYIYEERYKVMVKDCLKNRPRLVIALSRPRAHLSDGMVSTYAVGAYADIIKVAEHLGGTCLILVHGQERCKVEAIDTTSHPYYSIEDRPYPLVRDDPNLEHVAAWDALDTFRRYAQKFFNGSAQEQLEEAIPDSLVYQASFICANLRVPAASRQSMLEAPSLIARLQIAQKLMQERLETNES